MDRKDRPSYPDLGKVYPGDYYPDIPYSEYIGSQIQLSENDRVFDLRSFGAVPDSGVVVTEAFRAAVMAAEEQGGGTILVSGGSYIVGSISLPSFTTLFVAPDASLISSRNLKDLLPEEDDTPDGCGKISKEGKESSGGGLLCIQGAKHVRITGGGRISGSGEWFVFEPREKPALSPFPVTMLPTREQENEINTVPGTVRTFYRNRIRYAEDKYDEGLIPLRRLSCLLWVDDSENVEIDHVILHDSMAWTLKVECSDHVRVHDIVIDDNRHVANTDGIDVCGSSDVDIRHCFISCADDGIVIKNPASTGRDMENVRIHDCMVMTVMNCFKIGTETYHDIRHITVEDCAFCLPDIYPGSTSGIAIESCDGSSVSDIRVTNIRMNKVLCPVYLCLNMRNRAGDPYIGQKGVNRYWGGSIRDVLIENVYAENAELPCILTGFVRKNRSGERIRQAPENITIRNFTMIYRNNEEILHIPEEIPEFYENYPESNAHGDVDASGIWARHLDNLRLDGIQITPRSGNTRKLVKLTDVRQA